MWSNNDWVTFVYLKIIFAEPKKELSTLSSISFLDYESQKKIFFENVLEFRQISHWNVLIVLGCCYITLLQSSFPTNLDSFYVIEEPLTKTSKLSTVSRLISNLKCFPWNSFKPKNLFCCINVKIKFVYFKSDYEISEMKQRWVFKVKLHVKLVLYSLTK